MNEPTVYTHCPCRDCRDIVCTSDTANPGLCFPCDDEGCDVDGEHACARHGAEKAPT